MPYLHWETSSRRQTSVAPYRKLQKDPLAPDMSVKVRVLMGLIPRRRNYATTPLAHYLVSAATLYTAMNCLEDRIVLDEYLRREPPLHPRRSLNQYDLWTSLKDDTDQVVYRETRSRARARPGGPALTEPSLVMVDQLWLWILDGSMFSKVLFRGLRINLV